jgi:hypothetical protein
MNSFPRQKKIFYALLLIAAATAALFGNAENLLYPGYDLVTISGNHINGACNSGQSGQNLQHSTNSFHKLTSLG